MLYNGETFVTVDHTGAVINEQAAPPIDRILAITQHGDTLAYIETYAPCQSRLVVYDLQNGSARIERDVESERRPCAAPLASAAFTPDGGKLALGVRLAADQWDILVLNAHAGSLTRSLMASTAPIDAALAQATDPPTSVRFLDNDRLHLTIAPDHPYTWDIISGALQPSIIPAGEGPAVFTPSGETLAAALDLRFAHARAGAPNALHIYDPVTRERFPFYVETDRALSNPVFAHNGRHIFAQAHDQAGRRQSLLISRDGRIIRPLRDINRLDINATATGLIYCVQHNDVTDLVHFDTDRPFSDQTIWTAPGRWRILWVHSEAQTFGPYTRWSRLAAPLVENPQPALTVAATPFPSPEPILYAGMTARIQTVGGEVLYLRDAPGTGAIIKHLYNNNRVDLLEGPRRHGDYDWWHLRTADDGTQGWAAQAVDDLTTILPIHPDEDDDNEDRSQIVADSTSP